MDGKNEPKKADQPIDRLIEKERQAIEETLIRHRGTIERLSSR